ncbi:MAG: hypothetical protein QXQ94_10855 [Candidatus Bathyarchaeia archaeon]
MEAKYDEDPQVLILSNVYEVHSSESIRRSLDLVKRKFCAFDIAEL